MVSVAAADSSQLKTVPPGTVMFPKFETGVFFFLMYWGNLIASLEPIILGALITFKVWGLDLMSPEKS